MFANPVPGGPFGGDGLYVYDVQPGYAYGNLQAWFHYPCDPARCTDPLEGKVRFGAVQYDPPGEDTAAGEYVELVNATSAPVSLGGYALARRSVMNPLPPTTTIAAKGTLRIVVGTGTDAPAWCTGPQREPADEQRRPAGPGQPDPGARRLPGLGLVLLRIDAGQRTARAPRRDDAPAHHDHPTPAGQRHPAHRARHGDGTPVGSTPGRGLEGPRGQRQRRRDPLPGPGLHQERHGAEVAGHLQVGPGSTLTCTTKKLVRR